MGFRAQGFEGLRFSGAQDSDIAIGATLNPKP